MLTVTTSWDDGDVLDTELASLLNKYDIKGNIYVTRQYRKERLSDGQIRDLSETFEMGAHSLTHPDLRLLGKEEQKEEICGSKVWLEDLLGKEVSTFCYPSGRFNDISLQVVRESGFRVARTTVQGKVDIGNDPYQIPTTVQVYPMPFRKTGPHGFYWRMLLESYRERAPLYQEFGFSLPSFRSFESLARASFDEALRRGGMFHLWGHSWEIEHYNLWDPLERVLRYIGNRSDCRYVTNGELV